MWYWGKIEFGPDLLEAMEGGSGAQRGRQSCPAVVAAAVALLCLLYVGSGLLLSDEHRY